MYSVSNNVDEIIVGYNFHELLLTESIAWLNHLNGMILGKHLAKWQRHNDPTKCFSQRVQFPLTVPLSIDFPAIVFASTNTFIFVCILSFRLESELLFRNFGNDVLKFPISRFCIYSSWYWVWNFSLTCKIVRLFALNLKTGVFDRSILFIRRRYFMHRASVFYHLISMLIDVFQENHANRFQ